MTHVNMDAVEISPDDVQVSAVAGGTGAGSDGVRPPRQERSRAPLDRVLNTDDPGRAAGMAFWIATSALERRVHTDMWRHWQSTPGDDWDTFVADLVQVPQAFLLPMPGDDAVPALETVSPGESTGTDASCTGAGTAQASGQIPATPRPRTAARPHR